MSKRTKEKKNIVVTFTRVEYDEKVQQEVTSEVTKEGPMTLMEALKLMNRLTHYNGMHAISSKEGLYETDWMEIYENGSLLWKDNVKFEEV